MYTLFLYHSDISVRIKVNLNMLLYDVHYRAL